MNAAGAAGVGVDDHTLFESANALNMLKTTIA